MISGAKHYVDIRYMHAMSKMLQTNMKKNIQILGDKYIFL